MNGQTLSSEIQCHFLRTLSAGSEESSFLQYIVDEVMKALQASACSIYTVDANKRTATQRAGAGHQIKGINERCRIVPEDEVAKYPKPEEKLGLTGWIISTGKSFLAKSPEELKKHPHRTGLHDPDMLPGQELLLQTFLGVPLRGQQGDVIGVIKAERRFVPKDGSQPFSVEEQIILETVARITSRSLLYLEAARTRSVDSAITAWAREVIAEASASEGDMDRFLSIVVNVATSAMRADSCGIYLIDQIDPDKPSGLSRKTLTQRAGLKSQAPLQGIRSYYLPNSDEIKDHPIVNDKINEKIGLTAWIAAKGESFYAPNFKVLSSHPHHRGAYDYTNFKEGEEICGAFLGVPLQVAGETLGTLKVENISKKNELDTREFTPEGQRRFDVLAQDIALAIRRLQEHSLDPYKVIIDAQETIFLILSSNQPLKTLVQTVVQETMRLLSARACALFLSEGDDLVQPEWAAAGYAQKVSSHHRRYYKLVTPDQIKDDPKQEEKVGLTVWIAVKRKKFVARSNLELKLHPNHLGTYDFENFDPKKGDKCESIMGVPLVVGGKLVGVLKVETKKKILENKSEEFTYFSEQDEIVFDLIANSVAIAIENARLSESRRLAQKILGMPARLLFDLQEYVRENPQSTETLRQVANQLRGEKEKIAEIIDCYADLLLANLPFSSLQVLPELVKAHRDFVPGGAAMAALYQRFVDALNVQSMPDLAKYCSVPQVNMLSQMDQAQALFSKPIEVLSKMTTNVNEVLQRNGSLRRSTLETTRAYLEIASQDITQCPYPERAILDKIIQTWTQITGSASESFKKIENPYIVAAPVNPERGSSFFGRQDIFQWVSENLINSKQKNTLFLHGEARMGKTSILLQLQKGELGKFLRERKILPLCPVYIDLQGINDPGTGIFLYKWSKLIVEQIHLQYPILKDEIKPPERKDFDVSPYDVFDRFLTKVNSYLKDTMLVLMVDEFERLDRMVKDNFVDTSIYTQLRSWMQFKDHLTFLLAGTHEIEEVSEEYRKLVLNNAMIRKVGFMNEDESSDLIQKPVEGIVSYQKEAVDELYQWTHGHPYLLQYLCHELVNDMNQRGVGNFINQGHIRAVVEKFALQNESHLDQLWHSFSNKEEVEKAVLFMLAYEDDINKSFLLNEIASKLSALDKDDINKTLGRLSKRGIIEATLDEQKKYRLPIKLFARWIKVHISPNPRWGYDS